MCCCVVFLLESESDDVTRVGGLEDTSRRDGKGCKVNAHDKIRGVLEDTGSSDRDRDLSRANDSQ